MTGEAWRAFDYAIRVQTAGLAPGTTLKDTAPQGTRFVRIVRPPNQGSCSLENVGKQLTCKLGNLIAGQSVDIAVRVELSVAQTSTTTIENTAVATCHPNPAVKCTSKGTATTRLLAPFLPPAGCNRILVDRLVLNANSSPQPLVVRVGQNGKPVAGATVVLTGPGIRTNGNTGSTGLLRTTVTPHTAGVLTVGLRGSKACSIRHIGIASAATPSVTG